MSEGLSALFWGVVTFSLLVVIHEGGHFAAARLFGVKVHEFMVGLPGPALRLRGPKTTYGVTAIPLGGYVRIAGMEPGPEDPMVGPVLAVVTRLGQADAHAVAEELGIDKQEADKLLLTLADWDAIVQLEDDEYSYRSRFSAADAEDPVALLDRARAVTYRVLPTWKRIVLLSSGVVLNLLTAVLVFTVVLAAFGYYEQTGGIDSVTPDSAAAVAGLRAGDMVTAIDGEPIESWQALVTTLQGYKPGDRVAIVYERDGARASTTAVLDRRPGTDSAMLGVAPAVVQVRPGIGRALVMSVGYIGLTFQAIAGFFNPETFRTSIEGATSVIGASYIAADAAKAGPLDYAGIVALLSLSLGVINIFPIPPLDGGKIVVEVVEHLRGRPLSRKVSLSLSAAGAMLLFALIGYLVYADVNRFIVG
jgi:regulator of sigma E protease